MVLLWSLALPGVTRFWAYILRFWAPRLGFDAALAAVEYDFLWVRFDLPYLSAKDTFPSVNGLVLTALLLALALLLSIKMPAQLLPLTYLIRAAILVQATGVIYFFLKPDGFPHNATDYGVSLLKGSLALLTLVPVILALTYYILNFDAKRKIALTVVMFSHLIVFVPHHYLVTLYLLNKLSLAVLPVLYPFFGLLLDVTVFIGLYSWGMSWKSRPIEEI